MYNQYKNYVCTITYFVGSIDHSLSCVMLLSPSLYSYVAIYIFASPAHSLGSGVEVEVVIATFHRLCEELEPAELEVVWDSMIVEMRATLESMLNVDWSSINAETSAALESEYSTHLSCLLSVLVSTLQRNYIRKLSGDIIDEYKMFLQYM